MIYEPSEHTHAQLRIACGGDGVAFLLRYGSDALAGVINVITDDSTDRVDASSRTQMRSKGRFEQDINVDATVGRFSSQTSYTHRQADNWQVNHYQAFSEGGREVLKLTGRPMSTAFRSENLSQQMEWQFVKNWSGKAYEMNAF